MESKSLWVRLGEGRCDFLVLFLSTTHCIPFAPGKGWGPDDEAVGRVVPTLAVGFYTSAACQSFFWAQEMGAML